MVIISFDTDHMSQERMTEWYYGQNIQEGMTFYCTDSYECLNKSKHEVAPHAGFYRNLDDEEIVRYKKMFPEAKGWRSHSCAYSQYFLTKLHQNAYHYLSTEERFLSEDIKPYRTSWGLWQMPIYYMDTVDISHKEYWPEVEHSPFSEKIIDTALSDPDGLYVFDFHQIHIMLNTPSTEFYFANRESFKSGEPIEFIRYSGVGVDTFYQNLINKTLKKQGRLVSLSEYFHDIVGS